MKILGIQVPFTAKAEIQETKPAPEARTYVGSWGRGYAVSFNGEKNPGEIGPIVQYDLDFDALRLRSWESYLTNDISKTVLDKFSAWIIGQGLKLQSHPLKHLLQKQGIELELEDLTHHIEARFKAWAKSKHSSFNQMTNLNRIARNTLKHGKIGGDAVVVLRIKNGIVNVQMIDGEHLRGDLTLSPSEGNTIKNGIECDATGKHIRYYIAKKDGGHSVIECINKTTGLVQAFIYYGNQYREDENRGFPIIGSSLETLKKIDRYKEAAVGSAEERQKISLFIEHMLGSDGSNPFAEQIARAINVDAENGKGMPIDDYSQQLAQNIVSTSNKQTYNLTPGSTIKAVDSRQELFFEEFYKTNANIICASIGIPPNVAFSLYTDSFSASRAATKDWEHTMNVERDDFQFQFYQRVYDFWLHFEVLAGRITIDGYLEAFYAKDFITLEAFRNARFTGAQFPHIDPLKEVQAERLKLGDSAKSIPLTTVEMATEALNGGDSFANIEQFADELKDAIERNITYDPTKVVSNTRGGLQERGSQED